MTDNIAKRRIVDGLCQYTAIIKSEKNFFLDNTIEYSDWFLNDEEAITGYRKIMEDQGYSVVFVEIGFPCVITIKQPNLTSLNPTNQLTKPN